MQHLFVRYKIEHTSLFPQGATGESVAETLACLKLYRPDISICDFQTDLWLALQIYKPPCRISIMRCQTLSAHERSSRRPKMFLNDAAIRSLSNVSCQFGGPAIENSIDLVRGEVILLPSVPQLDPLPEAAEDHYANTAFVYTGPLFLPIARPVDERLKDWIGSRRREGRPIVLVTLGTLSGTLPKLPDSQLISRLYRWIADSLEATEFAVLMVVPEKTDVAGLQERHGRDFQLTGLTDIQELAACADVVIHHGGHGTLQAVLLAGKPSVIVTTQSYAREDYSLRLEELCCGRYLRGQFLPSMSSRVLTTAVKEILKDSAIHQGVGRMSTILREQMRLAPAEIGRALARCFGSSSATCSTGSA